MPHSSFASRLMLACGLLLCAGARAAEPATTPTCRHVSIVLPGANGHEVDILLPIGVPVRAGMEANALREQGNVQELRGHAALSIALASGAPLTVLGDTMRVRREELDAATCAAVRDLQAMGESDQRWRARPDGHTPAGFAAQASLDQANEARLAEIVARYGWPGRRFAGAEVAQNAFRVVQHAPLAYQQRYLPMLRAAVARGDASPLELAMLEDRVRVGEGRPQRYGSQIRQVVPVAEPYPIEDRAHVDERRAAVGLMPLADYLKLFSAPAR
jgi:hypothetical protein